MKGKKTQEVGAEAVRAWLTKAENLSPREPQGPNSELVTTVLPRLGRGDLAMVRRYLRKDHHFAAGTGEARAELLKGLR